MLTLGSGQVGDIHARGHAATTMPRVDERRGERHDHLVTEFSRAGKLVQVEMSRHLVVTLPSHFVHDHLMMPGVGGGRDVLEVKAKE